MVKKVSQDFQQITIDVLKLTMTVYQLTATVQQHMQPELADIKGEITAVRDGDSDSD